MPADRLLDGAALAPTSKKVIADQRFLQTLRWQQMQTERSSWWSHWQLLSRYYLPRTGRFFAQDRNKGDRRHNEIYDSTATRALRVLGAGLMGGATSPARPWFRFGVSDPDLNKQASVKEWCAQVSRIVLDILAKSNTYRMLHNMYEELAVYGTGASILVNDFDNVIHNEPLTCGEYALGTDWNGNVNTLYRQFQKRVSAMVAEFGYDKCSPTVQNMYDRGNLEAWVTIIHAIEPRADRDPKLKDAKNMAYSSIYFEEGQSNDLVLREGGFKTFRALCPRWLVSGGDIYGNSPGMEALGDVRQLQHEQIRKAKGIDYMVEPPIQVPTAYKNKDINRLPGGTMYSDIPNAIKSAWDVNLNLEHLLGDIQDVRERIKSTFYVDLFLMIADAQEHEMTATEVAERKEEKLLMLGPVIERLHNELLQPLVDMVFQRAISIPGLLPPPPPALHGAFLNVEFISMLAQAQRAVATNGIDRFTAQLGQIAAFKPEVLDKFDPDKWSDVYSDLLGIDPDLIVADDKVALVRQQRAKAQQQQQQAAVAEQQSKAAKNLATSPTDGQNALTDITQNFSGYS